MPPRRFRPFASRRTGDSASSAVWRCSVGGSPRDDRRRSDDLGRLRWRRAHRPQAAGPLRRADCQRGRFCADAARGARRARSGVGLDIALGGLPFEQSVVERSSLFAFPPDTRLRTCSAEDLIVMKAFAARPKDWLDVEGIIIRQMGTLDWQYIRASFNRWPNSRNRRRSWASWNGGERSANSSGTYEDRCPRGAMP